MESNQSSLRPGTRAHGFIVERISALPRLGATAIELLHERSGARLLHLLAPNDAENLFSVTFPTPPTDDTGLPHILEHAVLGGSRRFPLKDPFFEMVKGSMATFINAMTASDHTMYPVASNVRQDFFNLAEVYWDAVFHPTLAENTFKREGHHLEFAEGTGPQGDLVIKGIVFNEMKGAYSTPDALLARLSSRGLMPDTPFGRDSGGDPQVIPSLTYEQFKRFHAEHYHPSHAKIFIYGDIPTEDHLVFCGARLEQFDRRQPAPSIQRQRRWTEPRSEMWHYPAGANDPLERRSFVTINWLIGPGTDTAEVAAFNVIDNLLVGSHAAPLRRALIDSGLGEDLVHSGFSAGRLETSFHLGIRGTDASKANDILDLVLATLRSFADDGITSDRVDAAFQQLAYRYLEIPSGYPLWLMNRVNSMWLYQADPLPMLRADEVVADLRRRYQADPQLFARLIREKLIDNPHRLLVTLAPDRDLQSRDDAAAAEYLRRRKQSMSPEQLRRIAEEQAELARSLDAPNTPEALATLPRLAVTDLPRKPRHIPTTIEPLQPGCELLVNNVFANGVNYLQIDLDLSHLPPALLSILPLYEDCVRKMGTRGENYVRTAERIAAHTGGVSFGVSINAHVQDPARTLRRGRFSIKFLDEKADEALRVLHDVMLDLDLGDPARLRDVLLQARASNRSQIVSGGMSLALRHAARQFSAEAAEDEILNGVPHVRLIERLAAAPSLDATIESLEAIRSSLRSGRRGMVASFTGSTGVLPRIRSALAAWNARMLDSTATAPRDFAASAAPRREGLAAAMNASYCIQAMPAPHLASPRAPALVVAARILSLDYLLEEIRFKGTAYGAGCGYHGLQRTWTYHSYRDPWITRTLNVYAAVAEHVRSADWSQSQVDRAIIGTAKSAERPIRPAEATSTALWRHVMGESREWRQTFHEAILGSTAEGVKNAALEQLQANGPATATCVVSSRERIEKANGESPENPLQIEEILTG